VLCLQYICDLIVTDIFKMLRVFRKMMKMLNLKYKKRRKLKLKEVITQEVC